MFLDLRNRVFQVIMNRFVFRLSKIKFSSSKRKTQKHLQIGGHTLFSSCNKSAFLKLLQMNYLKLSQMCFSHHQKYTQDLSCHNYVSFTLSEVHTGFKLSQLYLFHTVRWKNRIQAVRTMPVSHCKMYTQDSSCHNCVGFALSEIHIGFKLSQACLFHTVRSTHRIQADTTMLVSQSEIGCVSSCQKNSNFKL